MAGISFKAAGGLKNKIKYNGIEFENDLEIQTYDAFFRELDPQTARWWQVDPVTDGYEDISPYASMYDNPITYRDPLGNEGERCCGDLLGALIQGGKTVLISASGLMNGMISTISGGLISTDPLSFREILSEEEKGWFDGGVRVGIIAPLFSPGTTGIVKNPSPQPVNFGAVPISTTVRPALVPLSGNNSNNKKSGKNKYGGGKNSQHSNEKARVVAKERYERTKAEYESLNSKPNMTPDDKKQLKNLKKAVKDAKQKMDNTGENHSRSAKGSN